MKRKGVRIRLLRNHYINGEKKMRGTIVLLGKWAARQVVELGVGNIVGKQKKK